MKSVFLPLSLCTALSFLPVAIPAGAETGLTILNPEYPRVFFFRSSEGPPSRPDPNYDTWEKQFSRLMGIMGKCLDEEVIGREKRNPEFFTRFKKENRNQVVLLHFNGNARDPRYGSERFFSGHWIYREAVTILDDVPAESGETRIRVADARDFRIHTGRYGISSDDIALFGITPEGKHDWNHCEQVQLIDVDTTENTITVRRGCYGTKPLAFSAGEARAAAHAVEGPWGKRNHLMWFYNFSTHCPRDPQGRVCADVVIEDLAGWFGEGGKLEHFDGLEFDVLFNQTHGDTDGDGSIDDGMVDGRNQYGIGVVEFIRKLRQRMGDEFIIQADGALGPGGIRSQRAFELLNGIESEGFPNLNDWEFRDWSGGINRHEFWRENARKPVFNYINHKWIEPVPGSPGMTTDPEVPFGRHRLTFAAAQFTDAMLCYSFRPPSPSGRQGGGLPIWDEFVAGTREELGWLGRPEGETIRLALNSPDLLGGAGAPAGAELAEKILGEVEAVAGDSGIEIRPSDPTADKVRFRLEDLPVDGPELLVRATLRAEPRQGYPREMARFATATVSGGLVSLTRSAPKQTGMLLRSEGRETPLVADTGASVGARGKVRIDGETLPAYLVHPPYRGREPRERDAGYVYWAHDLNSTPPGAELRFALGMSDRSPGRSDGVWFHVEIAELGPGGEPDEFIRIFEETTDQHAWLHRSVSLAEWAGRAIRLKFVADCGPEDSTTTDQAYWGDVRVVERGLAEAELTSPESFMTWVNDREFTAHFSYGRLGGEPIDLAFEIEGSAPVTLSRLTIHPSPDAMARVFEGGLVLANPSLSPYTFDLGTISPGRTYRRIEGTPAQDPDTNDGRPVGATVTLPPLDALFLQRDTPERGR